MLRMCNSRGPWRLLTEDLRRRQSSLGLVPNTAFHTCQALLGSLDFSSRHPGSCSSASHPCNGPDSSHPGQPWSRRATFRRSRFGSPRGSTRASLASSSRLEASSYPSGTRRKKTRVDGFFRNDGGLSCPTLLSH